MLFTILIALAACLILYLWFRGGGLDARPPARFQVNPSEKAREPVVGSGETWPEEDWMELRAQFTEARLHTYRHAPQGKPKAIVFLFHDLQDHCGRYAHTARQLAEAGFVVLGLDLEGFGKSEGVHKGYVSFFHNYVMDMVLYQRAVFKIREYRNLESFCFGQGMGGMLAIRMALRMKQKFRGVVVVNPLVAFHPWYHRRLRRMAYWLSFLSPLFPLFRIAPSSDWSRNPQVGDDLLSDPLCCQQRLQVQTLASLQWSCDFIEQHVKEDMLTPFVYIGSSMDKLYSAEEGGRIMSRAPVEDQTILSVRDAWHDLLHEPDGDEKKAMAIALDWLEERYVTSRPPPAKEGGEEEEEEVDIDKLMAKMKAQMEGVGSGGMMGGLGGMGGGLGGMMGGGGLGGRLW